MKKAIFNCGAFPQRTRTFFTVAQGLPSDCVTSVVLDTTGRLFAGTDKGLSVLSDDSFSPFGGKAFSNGVRSMKLLLDGTVAVCSGNNVYIIDNNSVKLFFTADSPVQEVADITGSLYILAEENFYQVSLPDASVILRKGFEGGKGHCIAANDELVYISTDVGIHSLVGKRREWKSILPDLTNLPDSPVRCLSFDTAGHLFVGFDDGIAIHDNMNLWLTSDKITTLPKNAVYKIVTDKCGGRYFASDVGLICQKDGALKYLPACRWVPDTVIRDIAVSDDGSVVFVATDKGISRITTTLMTFTEKAEYYEKLIEKYHTRHGFVGCRNLKGFTIESGYPEISDNDGLWTSWYVAAESLRYGATGDMEALEKARKSLSSLLYLSEVSRIPGFTARAIRYKGEPGYGNGHVEWRTASEPDLEWKGETSSDEITGHFFALTLYYDICADDEEKEKIKKALCGMTDHIIRNNYRLVDYDNLPTTWALWDPVLLNGSDKWIDERGINSLELLSYLKAAYYVSKDEKYNDLYLELIKKHHFALNTVQHKIRNAHLCHIDDNLGFLSTVTLLRLEDDPALRSLYLCGLEDHWQYERVERHPLFNFIHYVFTGRVSDIDAGVEHLQQLPLDLINYPLYNSGRKDLVWDTEQEAWNEPAQLVSPLPVDERLVTTPDQNYFDADCAARDYAFDGTVFLLPYWYGRYYGIIGSDE